MRLAIVIGAFLLALTADAGFAVRPCADGSGAYQNNANQQPDNETGYRCMSREWLRSSVVARTVRYFAEIKWTSEDITAAATAILALITLILACGTIFLWRTTKDLVASTDDAFQRQLRAYVGIERMRLECTGFADPDYKPVGAASGNVYRDFLLVTTKNFGLTPAYDVRIWVNWQPMRFPERLPDNYPFLDHGMADPDEPQPTPAQHILHKDQTDTAMIAISDLRPFISTRKKETMLYLYGHIEYRDIYRRKWRATFCQSWLPWSITGVEFVPYKEHNDETEL